MTEFVHLHVHSEYSLLDGLSRTQALAARAREHNQPAVAITDHGTMFAVIEFHNACRASGVKPIIGVEAYLAPRTIKDRDPKFDRTPYHLILLAENETGYKNLLKLSTIAQLEGFYYNPRVDRALLEMHSAGLIATTGCLSGEIPTLLAEGKMRQAREALEWYTSVFKDRFYVELQDHNIPDLARINPELMALAREFNLKTVATNDVHYISEDDWFAQDVLLCIQTGSIITQQDRMRMGGRDFWFKSTEEMEAVWHDYPEALSNTLEVAERCNVDLSFKGYRLPNFPVPPGYTPASYLKALCQRGLEDRYGADASQDKRDRLEYELGVINRMGFDTYFLIVWDLTRYARENNIWFNVRGSAAGSIVAYCLGVTSLDPIENQLIFERFLNPDRISMPDIDLDFPDDAREEMIRYLISRYGKDNVAQIITFGKMLAKAALRDVGRALDYPLSEVDRVAKLIPQGPGHTIKGTLESVEEFAELYKSSDYLRKLIDNAQLLEGVARNASTHAAGVVVTDKPVVEYCPLHRPTRGDESGFPVTQFAMGDVEHIGLLKIDILGLATLTIMREACALIKARHGIEYDLSSIPVEDAEAFQLLARGDVIGVFQVEGGGMKRVLTQMKPYKFDHIVATISLYRPGPMAYIPSYIARLHGVEPITYRHPALEPILSETYGVMVYQEQIMRIARDCCGYSGGEADTLRKAVGKKNEAAILKQREQFVKGAVANGYPEDVFSQIFDDIEDFARYGFNKAHAADYAVLTCQTAFLKAHYTIEYMTALMCTDIARPEKLAVFIADARRLGIPVLPPDVRYSGVKFTIDDQANAIRFGLLGIKNVGEAAVKAIVDARGDTPFTSLDDFCRRVDLRLVNRRVLESLIKAGALDAFGHRAQLLQAVDRMLSVSASHHAANAIGQLSFFGGGLAADTFGDLPRVKEVETRTQLEWEKELMGVYFSPHPLLKLAAQGKRHVSAYVGELSAENDGQQVTLGGIITGLRTIVTRKGKPMAFLQLEDPQGTIEVVVFPPVFNDYREAIRLDALVLVRGRVQVREDKLAILADDIWNYPLETDGAQAAEHSDRPLPGVFERTPIIVPPTMSFEMVGQVVDDWFPPPEDWDDELASTSTPAPASADLASAAVEALPAQQAAPADGEDSVDAGSASSSILAPSGEENVGVESSNDLDDWVQPAEEAFAPEGAVAADPAVPKAFEQTANSVDGSRLETTPPLGAEPPFVEPPQSIAQEPDPVTPAPPPPPELPTVKLGGGVTIPSRGNGPQGLKNNNSHSGSRPNARPNGGTHAHAPVGRELTGLFMPRGEGGRRLRVRLRRSSDTRLDMHRMREVVRLLRSADGIDRFALVVPTANSMVELDFPNYYTNYDQIAQPLLEMLADWGELEIE